MARGYEARAVLIAFASAGSAVAARVVSADARTRSRDSSQVVVRLPDRGWISGTAGTPMRSGSRMTQVSSAAGAVAGPRTGKKTGTHGPTRRRGGAVPRTRRALTCGDAPTTGPGRNQPNGWCQGPCRCGGRGASLPLHLVNDSRVVIHM